MWLLSGLFRGASVSSNLGDLKTDEMQTEVMDEVFADDGRNKMGVDPGKGQEH